MGVGLGHAVHTPVHTRNRARRSKLSYHYLSLAQPMNRDQHRVQ
jgi:hypothetical protein